MCMCIKSVKRKFLRLKPNLQPKSWEDGAVIELHGQGKGILPIFVNCNHNVTAVHDSPVP